MTAENTLDVDLDRRVRNSPRFKANTVNEYFQNSHLDWWKPKEAAYLGQELSIKNWLAGKKFENGLEIGPGFGRITENIAPHVQNLTLLEINNKAIRKLEIKFPSAKIIKAPAENYGNWIDDYGLVVAVEVLVHIPNIPSLLEAVSKSLDEKGIFITSITPDSFYIKKRTIIHRGINQKEFESVMPQYQFNVGEKVQNEHLLTYYLIKKSGKKQE